MLSPSTERIDRGGKLAIYARKQVGHVWLVNPVLRQLELLRLGSEGRWTVLAVYHDEAFVRAEPFDAVEIELGLLWADVERADVGHASPERADE